MTTQSDSQDIQDIQESQDIQEEDKPKRTWRVVSKDTLDEQIEQVQNMLSSQIDLVQNGDKVGIKFLRSLVSRVKIIQKDFHRIVSRPSKRANSGRVNGGFLKEFLITDGFCDFAGWDKGSSKSRVDITRALSNYIRENDLGTDVEGKKMIVLDARLSALLGVPDNLTFSSLQKHISQFQVKH